LTRRDFLRTSAIAAGSVALPYFVPGSGDSVNSLTFKYANGLPLIKKLGPQKGVVQFIGDKGWVGVSHGGI
jgi:hypothetical protein